MDKLLGHLVNYEVRVVGTAGTAWVRIDGILKRQKDTFHSFEVRTETAVIIFGSGQVYDIKVNKKGETAEVTLYLK